MMCKILTAFALSTNIFKSSTILWCHRPFHKSGWFIMDKAYLFSIISSIWGTFINVNLFLHTKSVQMLSPFLNMFSQKVVRVNMHRNWNSADWDLWNRVCISNQHICAYEHGFDFSLNINLLALVLNFSNKKWTISVDSQNIKNIWTKILWQI